MKRLLASIVIAAMLLAVSACAQPAAEETTVELAPVAESDIPVAEAPAEPVQVIESEAGAPAVEPDITFSDVPSELPAPEADPESPFGVDSNINVATIDEWLDREDVEYIDVRMLTDPGCYEAIGGDSMLSGAVDGFKIVPYPYIATLHGLPPDVAETQYEGPTLFDIEYESDGSIASVTANYVESESIIQDLFPKDKPIFLMCGGGGYAGFTKSLLVHLGYDESMIYNVGGFWDYDGDNLLEIKTTTPDGTEYYAFHRLNYHVIDFEQLHEAK